MNGILNKFQQDSSGYTQIGVYFAHDHKSEIGDDVVAKIYDFAAADNFLTTGPLFKNNIQVLVKRRKDNSLEEKVLIGNKLSLLPVDTDLLHYLFFQTSR